MDKIEFKKILGDLAQNNGFLKGFGGWFKQSSECLAILNLQKSNHGNYYDLNVKIFVQGAFGNHYQIKKNLVKNNTGDIFIRQPNEYSYLFNLDQKIEELKRTEGMENFSKCYLNSIVDKLLTREGIDELASSGNIYILPAIQKEMAKLTSAGKKF